MNRLCGPCTDEWLSWADYRQPVPFLIHTVGRRDPNAQFERWRDTIRSQRQLIVDHCAARHTKCESS